MSRDEAVKLALEVLREVKDGKLTEEPIDLAIIDIKDRHMKFSKDISSASL